MKTRAPRRIGLLFLVITAYAAAQEDVSLYEKDFYNAEFRRYKSYFLRNGQQASATQAIDAKYYKLDLRVTTSPQYIRGKMTIGALSRQNGLATVTLDMMNSLTVDSVYVGGTKTGSVQYSSSFDVALDRPYSSGELVSIDVFYRGVPGSSGFGSFEFSSHSGVPWVWTLSEPYGAKDWWPCNDHPLDKADSAEIIVTCDSLYKVGSNGKLLSVVNNGDGTSTHHWKTGYPISTYLISIAFTNYAQFSNWFRYSAEDSMEVLNYVIPENLADAMAGLPRAVDGLEIFSDLFGLYPFIGEKYGHAQFGWGGGMEHQTMTYLGGFSEGLVIHELAHQWFGDMITCRTWPDLWLNEGFATYCEALYYERKYGPASYWGSMSGKMASAMNASGTLYLQDTSGVWNMFAGSRVYNKGASVLHMLRHVVGDTMFFRSLYNYANDPALKYGTASTADFQAVCEATSGEDLDYFFDEWVFGEKYPNYTYGWTSEPAGNGFNVTIGLRQSTGTDDPSYFTMPIDFKIFSAGWDTTVVLFNNQATQTFHVQTSRQPVSVQLDPQGWILKTRDSLNAFAVSPGSRDYGDVCVNLNKLDSVTVYNTGLTDLHITSVVSDNAEFAVTPPSDSISPSSSGTFYIAFRPLSAGEKSGIITFVHNGPGSPDQVAVAGRGIIPSFGVSGGWNMVSLPVYAADNRRSSLFPGAVSEAFRYDKESSYVASDSILNGKGYWLKFTGPQIVDLEGSPVLSDTFIVEEGWNMIGSIYENVAVADIVSEPPDIIRSNYFSFDNSYRIVDSLKMGRGYWVKAVQPGALIVGRDGADKSGWPVR